MNRSGWSVIGVGPAHVRIGLDNDLQAAGINGLSAAIWVAKRGLQARRQGPMEWSAPARLRSCRGPNPQDSIVSL